MEWFDFGEELGDVYFVEAATGVPSEASNFVMKKNDQDKFLGGAGSSAEKQQISLGDARKKILKSADPEFYAGMQATEGKMLIIDHFKTPDGKQGIDLIGMRHLHQLPNQESRNVMIDQLDGKVQGYLDATASDSSKRLFMIEGAHVPGVGVSLHDQKKALTKAIPTLFKDNDVTTKQEAEDKFGEMGTIMHAAAKEGVSIVSPEPSEEEIIQKLKDSGISDADLAIKQAARHVDEYVHRGKFRDEQRFSPSEVYAALSSACEQTGWQKDFLEQARAKLTGDTDADQQVMKAFVDHVLPQMNARMHENQVGFNLINPDYSWAFDPRERAIYDRLHAPYSEVPVFNKISNISNDFRNERILDSIHEAVAEGKSPFVVFGQGHTVQLEPAVSALYQKEH